MSCHRAPKSVKALYNFAIISLIILFSFILVFYLQFFIFISITKSSACKTAQNLNKLKNHEAKKQVESEQSIIYYFFLFL